MNIKPIYKGIAVTALMVVTSTALPVNSYESLAIIKEEATTKQRERIYHHQMTINSLLLRGGDTANSTAYKEYLLKIEEFLITIEAQCNYEAALNINELIKYQVECNRIRSDADALLKEASTIIGN